ncbi:endolytic transglycosylase MltG, partial [bacterium]|nr:endolytic transglycosylase MltG [bacterium]
MNKQSIVTIILILIFLIWWQPLNFGKTAINIPEGANAREIVEFLSNHQIVRDKDEFLFCLKISGKGKKLKSGTYTLYKYKNPIYVINSLVRGGKSEIIVTIPEGSTIYQTADILSTKALVVKDHFIVLCKDEHFIRTIGLPIASLEGYLFPDTYSFNKSQSDTAIIKTFITNFKNHIKKFTVDHVDSLHKIIILASLVEKEAKFKDERPIIAAIFTKRLKTRRPLESCATVLYALKNRDIKMNHTTEKYKTRLTEKDLQIDSPYNTYLHPGLPPGPICSPGEASIEAVITPADVEYLYFVAKG